ncbi:hypothetical protein LJC72_12350 [Bacteroides sp. OttesenSCG-928-D19]|nr:hypothetical protein [Bacteroides sp. OttesenSCG-928-D19]
MKKLFVLAGIFLLWSCDEHNNLEKDYGLDGVALESYIIENYTRDAKQLYFHEMIQNSTHAGYDNPVIDENEVNKILQIIQAVYNLDIPERDTVFDVYKIHGYYCYSFNSINLKVNTELPEIQNLSENIFPTGETSLDNLLDTYSFDSVSTFYSYPEFSWLTIHTKKEYNMIPIEKAFDKLESVQIAEFNKGCVGDGNTMTLMREANHAIITFSIGHGDCPAGCIYHKYWEFKVSDGIARFIKSYED